VDIFALGTLLYELYSGEIPYHGLDPSDIKERILKDSNLPMKIAVRKPVAEISKSWGN
jgi:serine/threonine protein kinase